MNWFLLSTKQFFLFRNILNFMKLKTFTCNLITGSSITVSSGGAGYASASHGQSTALSSSYGGGANGVNGQTGYSGQGGVLIVRYQIGTA